jgi:mannitol/fructose-specific phosphotransferase system IIA component
MTKDTAIHIARETLTRKSIQGVEYLKAILERRDNRSVWIVIFGLIEEEARIIAPDTIFVEVDEETKEAIIIQNP